MTPFIIFAHARSGSNNLAACLHMHPDVRVAEEPFHPEYSVWNPGEPNYNQFIVDIATLRQGLEQLFARFNGIKILDYQLSEELYTYLLGLPQYKLIFLRRKNLLKAVVSGFIAEQTAVWRASDLKSHGEKKYGELKPLPISEVRDRLRYLAELQDLYRGVAARRPDGLTLYVDYEHLYSSDVGRNVEALSAVCAFLGLSALGLNQVDQFINPARAKISARVNYESLPNYREINDLYGSDRTGWLIPADEIRGKADAR
jgi:hypothetical protein